MKKLIGLIFTTVFTILLCVCTYAKVSSDFSTNLYYNDKYYSQYSQYLDNENAIKIPDQYSYIGEGENCLYLIKITDIKTQVNELYSCDNNLQNIEFVAYLPENIDDLKYYNNSIYFTKVISIDNGDYYNIYTELWSINLNTKKQTKYITYSGHLTLVGISNDYLIYYSYNYYNKGFKLYKQNLNNPLDKHILLSTKSYSNFELLGNKNIYITLNGQLISININTGKLLNTYALNNYYSPICEYNGYLYISYKNQIYKALENNTLTLISENNDIPLQYTHCYGYNNKYGIIYYSNKNDDEISYSYNIKTNEWKYIGTLTFEDSAENLDY